MVSVQILSAGWHVGDGEPEVRVDGNWTSRIELKRLDPTSKDDWLTDLHRAEGEPAAHMTPLVGIAGGYEFVAHPTIVGERWTALTSHGVHFAVPGTHEGPVRGRGVFVHDTYFISDQNVADQVQMNVRVERIEWAEPGTDLMSIGSGTTLQAVGSTHQRLHPVYSPSGTFIVTVSTTP